MQGDGFITNSQAVEMIQEGTNLKATVAQDFEGMAAIVSEEIIKTAMAKITRKKALPAAGQLRIETYAEGLCAQVLHIGPFSAEGPTIEKVHQFIAARGTPTGKHHEIYLSDIRKADPTKWKTIIRQPMR